MKIGFIGQGYVGKNYANDFEARGLTVARYSLEEPYINNKDEVMGCDVVFIAVPTPTTPDGFSFKILDEAISQITDGRIVVIKSTIVPGTTAVLQKKYPKLTILFSPEFLREATAAHDAAHPHASIVGLPVADDEHSRAATQVLEILPDAPTKLICSSTEAEMTKYVQNIIGYTEIVMFNLLYNVAEQVGANWDNVREGLVADPNISRHFAHPAHKGGRGAGGSCLIKDFAAMREIYQNLFPSDAHGNAVFASLEKKNLELLVSTNKTMDHVRIVYGDNPQI